jgi:diadenosine tetraphosphate (Ap4A) HIT family hydrolase
VSCSICDWSVQDPDNRPIFETASWRVVLAPNQSLVGRCVLHLKRHCEDLADVKDDELLDWLKTVTALEKALRSAFEATMFNWSCYMNHAYREEPPQPHVHWWAVPRYNHPVRIGDWIFEDPDFGNPYDHARWLDVPIEIRLQIVERIRKYILFNPSPWSKM